MKTGKFLELNLFYCFVRNVYNLCFITHPHKHVHSQLIVFLKYICKTLIVLELVNNVQFVKLFRKNVCEISVFLCINSTATNVNGDTV